MDKWTQGFHLHGPSVAPWSGDPAGVPSSDHRYMLALPPPAVGKSCIHSWSQIFQRTFDGYERMEQLGNEVNTVIYSQKLSADGEF